MTRKKSEIDVGKKEPKQVSISIGYKKSEVALRKRGPYTDVVIKEGVPIGKPGQPALPWRKFYVSVPWDAVPGELIIKDTKIATLAEGIPIEPCQPDVPTLLGTEVEWVMPDRELYASEVIWPEVFARVMTVRRTGGFAMAELEICPFRYHLRSRKLELVERLDFSFTYTQTGLKLEKARSVMTLKHEQKFAERVKKMVLNPEDVSLYQDIKAMGVPTERETYPQIDYVIITSNSLADKFQRLATWRTLLGIRAKVVTVEDIKAGTVPDTGRATFWHTSGYYDGGTRDEAEAIRNFIKWASVNWLTDYVLLGGDTEIIHCRQAIHSRVGSLNYRDINSPNTRRQLGYSPVASTEEIGTSASNVLDEDVATVWKCAIGDPDPWIQLSVHPPKAVNRVDLTWGATHATSYTIQVSHDGITWTDVYTTTSGSGGTERLSFDCTSASYMHLRIISGTNFSLASMRIYGPSRGGYGGVAYRMNDTITHVYLSHTMSPNPTNSLDENLILIKEGPHAGTIVLYDVGSNDTNLGWHFVEDLVELPGTVKNRATSFIEICGPAEYHGNSFVIKDDYNHIPADLYYSDIAAAEYPPSTDHDWDADRNGIYGERYAGELDSVNGFADIYVGRASVETPEEADTFIDKVLRYEKFQDPDGSLLPMDFAVSVLLGSQNWYADRPGRLDGSARGKEDIRRAFLDFNPSRWLLTRRYEDYADVPPVDQTADLSKASKEEILNAIRDGQNVVSLSSHGSYGYLCYLVTNDIDDAISPPSIFYGNACSTNKFDVPLREAFSEWTILNANGAAVAYIGNSRYGWTGDNPIELRFWEKMLDSGRLGEMFNACKQISHDWAKYSLNLLGDPAIRVWSDRPRQLKVTHPEEIGTGKQKFQVIVTSAGHPVQDALVCVTMEGTLFITANTNASGVAFLTVPAGSAGIMQITVSGKNLIPYLGSVTVKKEGCIIADCAVGLGQFDQECGGYPVIDDQELYNGKPTCKALDVCGIQAHAGYYLIGSGGKDFECNINKFPYLNLIMKAEKDTDTCLLLMLHDNKPAYMRRFVMVGKTPKGTHPGYFDDSKDCFIIKDDEQWHDYTYDLRKLKEDYPNAETIKIAQFYSSRYCNGASHAFHISKLVCEGGDTGTWSVKKVDSIQDLEHGGYISIALDCNDDPHVSYADARHLKYAKWTGNKWSIESVDRVSDDYWETSIALDSNGYPHISYIDVDDDDLKYAKWTGNKWSIKIVDSGGVGGNISLALDSNGYPHISYCGNRNLMYAKWTGTTWSIKTVDSGSVCAHTSIALDSNGYPHISYYDFKNHNLKYAKWTGNKWSIKIVDSVEVLSEYGGSTSIALDSDGYPHISYHDDANHNTKYAKWTGTAWSIETIYHTGYIGMYISIAVDSNGHPHISFYNRDNKELKYAKWTGTAWSIKTVDSVGFVGFHDTSIAVDSNGYPHILYLIATIHYVDLKYARLMPFNRRGKVDTMKNILPRSTI